MTHTFLSLMYPRISVPATFLLAISDCKTLPFQNVEWISVYTACPSSWKYNVYCQFQSPVLNSQHPLNNRLYGLRIVLACFMQEKDLVPFLGVKPSSVSFTTCSLVTILILLCWLPLLALLWFIEWNGRWMQFNIILCVGLQNCLRRRKYCSYRFQLSCAFHGKESDLYS